MMFQIYGITSLLIACILKKVEHPFGIYYQVNLIHEDYIPENAVFQIIDKLSKIQGLKEANEDVVFDYTIKSKTDTVVEAAVIIFTEPIKGYSKRLQ